MGTQGLWSSGPDPRAHQPAAGAQQTQASAAHRRVRPLQLDIQVINQIIFLTFISSTPLGA